MKYSNHPPIKPIEVNPSGTYNTATNRDRIVDGWVLVLCLIIVLTAADFRYAAAEELSSEGTYTDSISIEVNGILRTGQMAIGGETTGTTITSKGIQFDVDWSNAAQLARQAEQFDGKHVRLSGTLRQQTGPERGRRFIINAKDLSKTPIGDQRAMDFRLDSLRWKKRPLLIFSPDQTSLPFQRLLGRLNELQPQIRDREMAILQIVGDDQATLDGEPITAESAEHLRARFKIPEGEFAVILVGKDGTEKFRSQHAVNMQKLFERIDSMPMRQREMRQRK